MLEIYLIKICFHFSNWGLATERECPCNSNKLSSRTLQDSGITGETGEGEEEVYASP
jgi:hypothetical protein